MEVRVDQLSKAYGGFHAVEDVSFRIGSGKLAGLLGPSGSGKTTILRMLAGLEQPSSGDVYFDGRRMNDVRPQQRGIGFVFQNYALFRHMTVADNIAFGLAVQRKSRTDIRRKVEELLELTGLAGLGSRLPHQLSGGQRQRVAFARALAPEPGLLLLDEPFAAIDAKIRKELRAWLKETIGRLGITSLFVTHDQEEAVEVADEIVILHRGRLEQHGTPEAIYREPQSPFVAGFIGESTIVPDASSLRGFEEEAEHHQGLIRPEYVELFKTNRPPAVRSAAEEGVVRRQFFRGSFWEVEVEAAGAQLTVHRPLEQEPLEPGEPVHVLIHRVYLFRGGTGRMAENRRKTDPMPVYL
ncbi:sulfate/thiosulfate import ATP-binding protein CysA [Paenibacillus sp. J31TS4]|uniref:ABC transporter ATP-binding protein n=1 Tax=Paenibacillus sp. J31TS4 TaxID=2807195 RepID=UPI001B074E81|nr:ABC transporter ATP-binding protein [Paenibacillus sp. J31TS4]GIP38822.1 sulfate/thiosulfate import ATP-binding protein CysA [Paenibacillus sp. J31TS4]